MSDILSTPGWLFIYISTIKPKDMLRFTQPMQLTFIIINASLTYHKSPWLVKSPIFVGRRCALSFGTCFGQVQAERALAPRATGRSQDRRVESCLFGKWLYNIWRDVYIYDVYTWLYMYIQGNYACIHWCILQKPAVKHGEVAHCERSENRGSGGGSLQTDHFEALPHLIRVAIRGRFWIDFEADVPGGNWVTVGFDSPLVRPSTCIWGEWNGG